MPVHTPCRLGGNAPQLEMMAYRPASKTFSTNAAGATPLRALSSSSSLGTKTVPGTETVSGAEPVSGVEALAGAPGAAVDIAWPPRSKCARRNRPPWMAACRASNPA